ncbi:Bmt6p [Sugiyamaella lignohabitans]|uniref:Bmt6p n=1 Tax=Sugiyamaella lignohabitans TaxID=796027 RepID=A0A161HFD5_9ASCO|nr:Bmt6p [Sugiyamaella lignohabitans]ANB14220.1 Bmt6p [Sugiyamaella lignohabitans]
MAPRRKAKVGNPETGEKETKTADSQSLVVANEILDLFKESFSDTLSLDPPELQERIQSVKTSLFDRNYMEAFGSEENLEAYVVRWTPSRALSYSHLFSSITPIRDLLTESPASGQGETKRRVLSIGGGAGAEIVGVSSVSLLRNRSKEINENNRLSIDLLAVDVAKWDNVVNRLDGYVQKYWPQWGRMNGTSELEKDSPLSISFLNHDILTISSAEIQLETLDLITCMFTTNELFASSKAGTVKFLHSLSSCKPGALLLIVESAGSYSEIQIGSKTFPVQFLIDHTLTSNKNWAIIDSEDSRWYRVPDGLKYPLKLENMRFFFKLYRRL